MLYCVIIIKEEKNQSKKFLLGCNPDVILATYRVRGQIRNV